MAGILLIAGLAVQASGQSLGDGVEAAVEEQIEAQVEADVEAEVEASVEQQVEAEVEGAVEQQVEAAVESQVEAGVEAAIEEQVEAGVEAAVAQQVEAGVAAAVEQSVESSIAATVEGQVESGISQSIELDLEASITDDIELGIEGEVSDALELGVEAEVGEVVEAGVEADVGTAAGSGDESEDQDAGGRFAGDLDPEGRQIEGDVWVVLVPAEYSDRIEDWGFTVRERRDLGSFDRVMLRVNAPGDRSIAQAALELALDAPGTVVDYNHVYDASQDGAAAAMAGAVGAGKLGGDRPAASSPIAIGLIDSAVDGSHPALAGIDLASEDFVPFENERPTAHGTAVASVLIDAALAAVPAAHVGKLWSASVFFIDDEGRIRATTAGLIAAIDWLARAPGVGVINMSLAGPPNRLLEVILEDATAGGDIVTAAVGNSGPAGKPLYPAAYDTVVGVTAVDAGGRIYRYANRGPHVLFAAYGVDVEVAAIGGYRRESGTSLASPRIAALLAVSMATGRSSTAALDELKAAAIDLGEPEFDEIFGFGLVRPGHPSVPAQKRAVNRVE